MNEKEINSFWSKVDKNVPTSCWLWTGHKDTWSYGQFNYYKDGKNFHGMAHRISYELLVGPIPSRLQIDHLCRVRHCVNPEHMEVVTCKENINRGLVKGQTWRRKLTEAQVLEIRRQYPSKSQRALAREFNVGRTTIIHIIKYHNWKNLAA